MDFRLLQTRLVSHVRERVRNGEISERGLARISGVSQPHIHNVLKGARLFSVNMADQILRRLRIDLMELMTAGEPLPEPGESPACRMIDVLDGRIGREHPFPKAVGPERYPFAAAAVEGLESPVAARLAPDPLRAPIFSGGSVVLLDRSEDLRGNPGEESYFALDLPPGGTIGLVRRARRHLYLWSSEAGAWKSLGVPNRDPLNVIRGRVSLIVRPF
jgi:hypothetical protein